MKIYLAAPGNEKHLETKAKFLFSFWDVVNRIPFRKMTLAMLGFKHENLCRYLPSCEGPKTSYKRRQVSS